MKPDYKLVAKAKYIHATADLASELWHEVYKRYYPAKQLDALVERLQSADLMHLYLKPEYRGKALGRDILASCERLARGEGRGRVWCNVHTKALPVQQFFKARGYRSLGPAENDVVDGIDRSELTFERML